MNVYYVNPGDPTDITPAAGEQPWPDGSLQTLPTGQTRTVTHDPAADLYYEDDQTTSPQNQYYSTDNNNLAFDAPSERVVRTSEHTPLPVQTVYERQRGLMVQLAASVSAQGVTVTLPSNGDHDLRSTEEAFRTYQAAQSGQLPGVTQTSDVDVWGGWFTWAISDVPAIMTQLHLLYAGTNGNAETHDDAMVAHRDASTVDGDAEWLALAEYDYTTGWPAPPTNNGTSSNTQTTETVPLSLVQYVMDEPRTKDKDRRIRKIMRFLHRRRALHGRPGELRARWIEETGA